MYTYPWRPENNFLQIIKNKISPLSKVCILGSTKEFRELCLKVGCIVDVYDTSQEMIEANTVGNKNENIYISNWLKIENKSYDYILGDLVLFLGDEAFQKTLLGNLKNNLVADGEILLRVGGAITDSTTSLSDIIQGCEYTPLKALNYISYELVVGLGYTTPEVSQYLEENNSQLSSIFQKKFIHLVPYGEIGVQMNYIQDQGDSIYKKNFLRSYEEILSYRR